MDDIFYNESGVNVLRAHVSLLSFFFLLVLILCSQIVNPHLLIIPYYNIFIYIFLSSLRKAIYDFLRGSWSLASYFRFLFKSLILVFFYLRFILFVFLEICTIVLDIQHSNLKYYICRLSLDTSQNKWEEH